jgi:tetratricopeptide (TPR) repeat protein
MGLLKGVLVVLLDHLDHKSLPDWLSEFSTLRATSPSIVARRIHSLRVAVSLDEGKDIGIFAGREDELKQLRRQFSLAPSEAPYVFFFSGWEGIGRQTLFWHAIRNQFPYVNIEPTVIHIDAYDNGEQILRKIVSSAYGYSKTDWNPRAGGIVVEKTPSDQIHEAVKALEFLAENKEIVVFRTARQFIQDDGDFPKFFASIISSLKHYNRPVFSIISQRRLKKSKEINYRNIAFFHVNPFSNDATTDLLSSLLKQKDISFSRSDLEELASFIGGHPQNIKLAVDYAARVGLESLIKDKNEFREIVLFRAIDVLKHIILSLDAKKILIALVDFRFLQLDDLLTTLAGDVDDSKLINELRHLEDYSIVVRERNLVYIPSYLLDAVSRSVDFPGIKEFRLNISHRILRIASEFHEGDEVKIETIDAVALAAVRSGTKPPAWIGQLILPAHLLRIARELYDDEKHSRCLDLAKEAWDRHVHLSIDAQVECLRLISISAARLNDIESFSIGEQGLSKIGTRTARRNRHFVRGFWNRLYGKADLAESEFKKALAIDSNHFHVLREIAAVLLVQERYEDAREYAKRAYRIAPTNPYIIDMMLECIIGSVDPPSLLDDPFVERLFSDLANYGDGAGRFFFDDRRRQFWIKVGRMDEALRHADLAVRKLPKKFGPKAARFFLLLELGMTDELPEMISEMRRIVDDAETGEGKSSRHVLQKAEILYELRVGSAELARGKLMRSKAMPIVVARQLAKEISARTGEQADSLIALFAQHAASDLGEDGVGKARSRSRRGQKRRREPSTKGVVPRSGL